jgi:hypothetical protein
MNRRLLLSLSIGLSIAAVGVACSSSSSTAGPVNTPPDGGSSGMPPPPPGPGTDASSSGMCTGASFDNTRIPGWPNVPSP